MAVRSTELTMPWISVEIATVLPDAVLGGGGQRVGAGRPLRAVIALAVPDEAGVALVQRVGAGVGGLSGRVGDRDGRGRGLVGLSDSRSPNRCRIARCCRRRRRCCRQRPAPGSTARSSRASISDFSWSFDLELLLDAGELHELLGELVGVERIERVLVLQLRRQQRQKGLEIVRRAPPSPSSPWWSLRWNWSVAGCRDDRCWHCCIDCHGALLRP